VDGHLDDLELSEENEVTATRWDEEQERLTMEKVMWEEFVKWKEENSKKVEIGVGTGEESGWGPVGFWRKVFRERKGIAT